MQVISTFNDKLVQVLLGGGIAVLRTDTIYGIVAKADNEAAVERVYKVKRRAPHKSSIILLATPDGIFDGPGPDELEVTKSLWPGKNSLIFPASKAPKWLDRGNESIAYRIPDDESLRTLLEKTGPLIAPSANPEGLPPAMSVEEAIAYFHDLVDIYVDGGQVTDNTPSRLFRVTGGELVQLR